MRRLLNGVIAPAVILSLTVYARGANDGTKRWHPWELTWDFWLLCVVVTSGLVGAGLRSYWRDGGHRADAGPYRRRRFDHDQVQLDADDSGR